VGQQIPSNGISSNFQRIKLHRIQSSLIRELLRMRGFGISVDVRCRVQVSGLRISLRMVGSVLPAPATSPLPVGKGHLATMRCPPIPDPPRNLIRTWKEGGIRVEGVGFEFCVARRQITVVDVGIRGRLNESKHTEASCQEDEAFRGCPPDTFDHSFYTCLQV